MESCRELERVLQSRCDQNRLYACITFHDLKEHTWITAGNDPVCSVNRLYLQKMDNDIFPLVFNI